MNQHLNVISSFFLICTWLFIGYIVFRIYRKQLEKPKVWKVILVFLFGLFTFSININGFETLIKLPILPLGVWILYFILRDKNNSWKKYRRYAWFAFFANFIFLLVTLIEIPIQHFVYPPNKPSTYLANVNSATIIMTHPSGKKMRLNRDSLLKQLPTANEHRFFSQEWYDETYIHESRKERFPYQLIGVKSKWGSGISSDIYIEKNGKGILIDTAKRQYYYRFNESILKQGGQ
ncbi:hypothetical protein [Bacillus sp. FJAT-49736]|uniref:hypothetical protein n=1 Tax=Bacillus sp. FJAT-49736 TaxID=2833582 RepID=UPI001BCA660F|nr:hypothetical protein [Bacillus sp. FJAT-49736]MBS4175108.1 hypothetical protein [Bacillus sp. FJAT-49736]